MVCAGMNGDALGCGGRAASAIRSRRRVASMVGPLTAPSSSWHPTLLLPGHSLVNDCCTNTWRTPLHWDGPPADSNTPIIVALGKFDAMHIGHRSLAVTAAAGGGQPVLLSFSGIEEVLGQQVRLPLVASIDRPRVLASWTPYCQGRVPRQRMLPFREIRTMPPEEFVAVLAQEMGAAGVVAGRNYRFGYKAAGDAAALQRLGEQYGMSVTIVDLVESPQGGGHEQGSSQAQSLRRQISSSKLRELLQNGDMHSAWLLLDRPYRMVTGCTSAARQASSPSSEQASTNRVHNVNSTPASSSPNGSSWQQGEGNGDGARAGCWLPASGFMNQHPAPGLYGVGAALVVMVGLGGSQEVAGGQLGGDPQSSSGKGRSGLGEWLPQPLISQPLCLGPLVGSPSHGWGISCAQVQEAAAVPANEGQGAAARQRILWQARTDVTVTSQGLYMQGEEGATLARIIGECEEAGQRAMLVLDFDDQALL